MVARRSLLLPVLACRILAAAVALAFAAVPCRGQDRPRPPNVLFLFADDQRADTIAALGNPDIETPALDRLVRRGFCFDHAYCMGSMGGAVCVPSRAMVHSGRSLFHVGAKLRGVTTLGEVFRAAGYRTFATGKWHNGPGSFKRSFERGTAVFFGGMSDHTKVPLRDLGGDGELGPVHTGKGFSSTLFADAAIDFLESCGGDGPPFFAYVAFTAPHDPRQAPAEFVAKYDPQKLPLPPSYLPQHPFDNGWMVGRDEALAPWPRTEEVIRSLTAEYYAQINHLDHEIGRVLAALQRTGRADDTVIVYSADHGLALGNHGLLGKQSLYEHSMRAPLIFVGPGIPRGERSPAFAYLFDIFPTLCELAGLAVPDGVDGKSLCGTWRGARAPVRSSVFTAFSKWMRAVRDERWKLICYPHLNKVQLFDLRDDPYERRDLAGEPEQAERIADLTARLVAWQHELGDRQPLRTDHPRPAAIDLSGRPRKPDSHQPAWIVEKYFGGEAKKR